MAYTLQLLHMYGESGLLADDTAPILGALVDKFEDDYTNTLVLAEGDTYIPGPFLVAGADPSLNSVAGIGKTDLGRPDVAILNALGVDVSALGNHEFDLGSPVLASAITASGTWAGAQFPFITSNLDFSADSALKGLADASLGGVPANAFAGQDISAIKGKIAPYAVTTLGGEKIGFVGATTYDLLTKTSPNGAKPKDDGNAATSDLQEVATYVQASVDALRAAGVNKIVMVDQLDTIERNKELASLVSGVDVMIAGGGHERLGDSNDVAGAFPGHDATFLSTDSYPITATGADGKPVLIVTTDTEFSYLGRLVLEFNDAGEIILPSLDSTVNGAYAANEATLQKVYGSTASAEEIVAGSATGTKVQKITDAVDAVVAAKDSNIFGYTKVYLEGDRVFGRAQEVNLGNLTADANTAKAAAALPNQEFIVSLKNGGGIRASIGSVAEDGTKVPPAESSVKPAGAISQLDIENALRFDNRLMVFDTTPQGLLNILNYAASLPAGNGGYPQVGGVRFSYDPDNPTGQKVVNVSLTDEEGRIIAKVVENGSVVAGAPSVISVVTLNFTANGGDGYPIKANGENFRYLLTDGTLSAPVSETLDFTAAANVPANALGEQKALQDFLKANHATPETAYGEVDTPASEDVRIENLNVRTEDWALGGGKTFTGTRGDDTLTGTPGDDLFKGGRGDDTLIGGDGTDTADYSAAIGPVNVNLSTGEAKTIATLPFGSLTGEASMIEGENGYKAVPLFTVGETLEGTTGSLNSSTAGAYAPAGILDGIGAYEKDSETVRIFVNHELGATGGAAYELETGVTLTGARISYFDIDKATKAIVDAGVAYGDIYDRAGNKVTSASQLDQSAGLDRFCSAALFEPDQFGTDRGIVDRIYFAGEETSTGAGGTEWALDTATGNLWAVPAMGRGAWENVTQLDTGTTTHVAFLLGDDTTGGPLYLYVGKKHAGGDFLDRNGLKDGKLYVWKADAAGVNSPQEFSTGSQSGTWVEIAVRDVTKAGTPGYDSLGYKYDSVLQAEADALGGFSFARVEDLSTNPENGHEAAFNATGAKMSADVAGGKADDTDTAGTIYKINVDFTSVDAPKGTLSVLYNSNNDPAKAIRNPDNMDWSKDGYIYINEDRSAKSLFTDPAAANTHEASILRLDPETGEVTRVGAVDRGSVPLGQTDTEPTDKGNWETSGILDVSQLFGEEPGSLFLTTVQAHSVEGGTIGSKNLVEGGQLVLIAGEGVDAVPNVETDTLSGIENIIGSRYSDHIVGDASANELKGGSGDDLLAGAGGADSLLGGAGSDTLLGGTGNDMLTGEAGDDKLDGGEGDDTLDGGAGNDTLAGGAGIDKVSGGEGDDKFDGGAGDDTLIGGAGKDEVKGGEGDDVLRLDAGNDTGHGEGGDDRVLGGSGSDFLYGEAGRDHLDGGSGNDFLFGGEGGDTLYGAAGNDFISGSAGADWMTGGAGRDQLSGGEGADVFIWQTAKEGGDLVVDFGTGDTLAFYSAGFRGLEEAEEGVNFFVNADGLGFGSGGPAFSYTLSTGELWFDADGGSSASGRTLIATLDGHPALTANDVFFI